MNRSLRAICVAFLGAASLFGNAVVAQRLDFNWKKEFAKNISWYVRTSPGILLVKSGKSLTALDGKDGRELWELADVHIGGSSLAEIPGAMERGKNLLEVPAMGVLLLNEVELPSGSERRLIALSLLTGERLWDAPPVDEMMAAIPLYESGHVIVVSRRPQKKILVAEVAATAASEMPFLGISSGLFPYPYRFELARLDLETGKVEWQEEYPRTFTPGTTSLQVFGNHLFVYFGNRFLGCVDLTSGKVLWDDGAKHLWSASLPLPMQLVNGRVIYWSKEVQAIDPQTDKVAWTIEKLGRVTGIFVRDGLVVAVGENRIAAVDATNGVERWRMKTNGHTTNLVWDESSDTLTYMDWNGFHRVQRTTGKSLLSAKLQTEKPPYYLRKAGPNAIVAIGYQETAAYDTQNGKLLFREEKLSGLFRADAVLDSWPLPDDGQELVPMVPMPSRNEEWESVRRRTRLSTELLQRVQEIASRIDGQLDVYQTEPEKGERKVWWVDGQTNRQMIVRPAATRHDVCRPLGNLYGVDGKRLWAARIVEN